MFDVIATKVEFVGHVREQLSCCALACGTVESESSIATTHSTGPGSKQETQQEPEGWRSPRLQCLPGYLPLLWQAESSGSGKVG